MLSKMFLKNLSMNQYITPEPPYTELMYNAFIMEITIHQQFYMEHWLFPNFDLPSFFYIFGAWYHCFQHIMFSLFLMFAVNLFPEFLANIILWRLQEHTYRKILLLEPKVCAWPRLNTIVKEKGKSETYFIDISKVV